MKGDIISTLKKKWFFGLSTFCNDKLLTRNRETGRVTTRDSHDTCSCQKNYIHLWENTSDVQKIEWELPPTETCRQSHCINCSSLITYCTDFSPRLFLPFSHSPHLVLKITFKNQSLHLLENVRNKYIIYCFRKDTSVALCFHFFFVFL